MELTVIGDHNYQLYCPPEGMVIDGQFMSTGWVQRPPSEGPYQSAYCKAWPFPNIPRDEWPERIDEYRKNKRSAFHLADLHNSPCKDQNGTNYCWINAPTRVLEFRRMKMGLPVVSLSPASCGALIKGYRNVGGYGTEGLEFMTENGCSPTELWPNNAIDRRYDNEESRAMRQNFAPTEWYELPPMDFDAKMTALLMGFELACAYNWWGHEITAVEPWMDEAKRRFGSGEENSWSMNWPQKGAKGRCVLEESKSRSSDIFAMSQAKPYSGPVRRAA